MMVDHNLHPGLPELVRDAAIQYRFMASRRRDQDYEGEIIYAVDADVFHLFGAPGNVAKERAGRLGYGQVFCSDTEKRAIAIASRLADYIFYELTDGPLLVIPPIEYEVSSILRALTEKLGSRTGSDPKYASLLRKLISDFRAELSRHDAGRDGNIPTDIIDKLQHILFFETGAPAELNKLTELLRNGRIAPPDRIAASFGDPRVHKAFSAREKMTDILDFIIRQNLWRDRLLDEYAGEDEKRLYNIHRDAMALAELELWNEKLNGSGYKVVYITGSRHILSAAYRISESRKRNFGEDFLRHPKAFLADNGALPAVDKKANPREQSAFSDWLETLVGGLGAKEGVLDGFSLSESGREVAEKAEIMNRDLPDMIVRRWGRFSDNVYASYKPPEDRIESIKSNILQKTGSDRLFIEWEKLRQAIDDRLETLLSQTWENCFRAATETGWSFAFHQNTKCGEPARIPALLRFDSWPRTQQFVHEISKWYQAADFDRNKYASGAEQAREEDPTGYAYYLAHAALFAGRGAWQIAAILCERAVMLCDIVEDDERGWADGREAHFFHAFCLRHTVRGARDPKRLMALVDVAEQILKEELKARPDLDAVPERFAVERLAIRTTVWLKSRFMSSAEASAESAGDIISGLFCVISAIDDRLNASPEPAVVPLLEDTRIRAAMNCVSLLLHSAKDISDVKPVADWCRVWTIVAENGGERSFFGGGLAKFALAVLSGDLRERKKLSAEAERHFLRGVNHRVFPYDAERFKDLVTKAAALRLYPRLLS